MISCKKATELIEKKNVVGLSLAEKFQLHMHTAMCSACTNYQKQSIFIDNVLKRSSDREMPSFLPSDHTERVNNLTTKILQKKSL